MIFNLGLYLTATSTLAPRSSSRLIRLIKDSGIVLVAKIAGLLAAIAVQLVADSVKGVISGAA